MEKRVTCYLDLDHTLLNTPALFAPIRDELVSLGHPFEHVDTAYRAASVAGYTFEEHLYRLGHRSVDAVEHVRRFRVRMQRGDEYLFEDVIPALTELHAVARLVIITAGVESFQREKVEGIHAFRSLIDDALYVPKGTRKATVLACTTVGPREAVFYLDNDVEELLAIALEAPQIQPVRMRRPEFPTESHVRDGQLWEIVHSLHAFQAYVRYELRTRGIL